MMMLVLKTVLILLGTLCLGNWIGHGGGIGLDCDMGCEFWGSRDAETGGQASKEV